MKNTLKAWLVVPALEEEATLARCLDAIDRCALPAGVTWAEWWIVDDGSMDATSAVATGWAAGHPRRHLQVVTEKHRQGKCYSLEQARRWFLERAGPDDVLVGINADVVVDIGAFEALLSPFTVEPGLTAAWGNSRPSTERRGRRASTFQMKLTCNLAAVMRTDVAQVEGRLWALRPQRIPNFAWDGDVVDDLQLSDYVASHETPCRLAPEAVVWVTPAHGLKEFHRQTTRSAASRRAMPRADLAPRSGSPGPRVTARVYLQTGANDPGGLVAYTLARAVSALWTAFGKPDSLRSWPLAHSSKGAAHPEQFENVQIPVVVAKAWLLFQTITRVRNWPSVLVAYGWSQVIPPQRPTAEMHFTLRDGTKLVCRCDTLSAWPVFEVFVVDAYRVGLLRALLPDEPVAVVDVGAHVGSTSVAFFRALRVLSVICAEPSPTSAALLRRNLASNAVPSSVVEAAVGATAGSVELVGGRAGSCEAKVARAEGPSDATPDRLTVPMVAMSDLLARAGEGPVLVKMDCEGSEYEILAGTPAAAWAPVHAIVMEYHPVAGTGGWQWLVERLTGLGFRLIWHAPDGRPGLGTACFARAQ